jgi:hypothetical protein
VSGVQGDVSNLGDLDRLFAQIKREKGKLDICVQWRHRETGLTGLLCNPLVGNAFSLYVVQFPVIPSEGENG